MAVKKRGLGKGLDSLIPNRTGSPETPEKPVNTEVSASSEPAEKEEGERIASLEITKVEPNRSQPRKRFNEEAIDELAASIKEHGVITPILVQKEKGYSQIIAGERRWRAARKAGLKEIPAIVKNYEGAERLSVSLIENIQREDLDPLEEALAYRQLIDEYSLTQQEVAKRVSKSRVSVTNTMRLLELDERVQAMITEGVLSMGHGKAILSVRSHAKQYNLALDVVKKKMSVRQTERAAREIEFGAKKPAARPRKSEDPYIRDMEERMAEAVGTKVTIAGNSRGKGKIEIEYYSGDELDRLYEMIRHIKNR